MIVVALVAVAVALLLIPGSTPKQPSLVFKPTAPAAQPATPAAVTYIDALSAVQVIQRRLSATDSLQDQQRAALNVITLAIVGAGDK